MAKRGEMCQEAHHMIFLNFSNLVTCFFTLGNDNNETKLIKLRDLGFTCYYTHVHVLSQRESHDTA